MIIYLVASAIFWLNSFPLSKPGSVLSNTKGLIQLVLVTVVDCRKVCRLQPVKSVKVHQYYEPRNKIDIDQTVREIVLGPQYNLQGGYF